MLHPTRPIRKFSYLEIGLSGNFFPVKVEEDSEGEKKKKKIVNYHGEHPK